MSNKALLFNGISDYVGIPSLPYFTGGQPHSYEIWGYLNNDPGANWYAYLICNGDDHNGDNLVISNGASCLIGFLYHGGDYIVTSDSAVPLHGWHHIVVTFSGCGDIVGWVKFYLDGHLDKTIAISAVHSWMGGSGCGGLGAWIRSGNPNANFLDGAMDEVRIYSKELSQEEVTARYNANAGWYGTLPDAGLVAGYHLDDDALDYSGNGNTGTVHGATYIAGKVIQYPLPNPPTDLVATPSVGSVGLVWDSMLNATSYNIYRSTVSGSEVYLDNAPSGSHPCYSDSAVVAGTKYYYKVASVGIGGESDKSIEVSAIPIPPAPTGITATAGTTNINLSWDFVIGASRYNIYRSTVPGSGYTQIAWTVTNGYVDSNIIADVRYYYVATALEGLSESAYSLEVNAIIPVFPPTGLSAIAGSDYVLLSWNVSLGAESYNIYRSITSGGGYSKIGNSVYVNHRDDSPTPEMTYYYVVTAVKGSNESAYSNEVSAIPTSSIWLDPFNGDDKGSGSESNPIKTVTRLLQMLQPGKTIHYIGISMGQPGYIYQIADPTFWNLG